MVALQAVTVRKLNWDTCIVDDNHDVLISQILSEGIEVSKLNVLTRELVDMPVLSLNH